jgi:hypothetical protein
MKISNVQIQLDKKIVNSGTKLSGRVVIRSPATSWKTSNCVFLRLYDEIGIPTGF